MKLSIATVATTVAATATLPATFASSSKSDKSGKGNTDVTFGLALPAAYDWLEGNYTRCFSSAVALITVNGEIVPSDVKYLEGCAGGDSLVIERLGTPQQILSGHSMSFQATFIDRDPDLTSKYTFEGTASHNPFFSNQVTMRTDYYEYSINGGVNYTKLDNAERSDVAKMICSKLPSFEDGSRIVCDVYLNENFVNFTAVTSFPPNFQTSLAASVLWIE